MENPSCHWICHDLLDRFGFTLIGPLTGPTYLFRLIFYFAPRIWGLKSWLVSAQYPRRIKAALGVSGRWVWGQRPVLPGDAAARGAGRCHSGSEQLFISSKREMNLSVFGFAFDPPRAENDNSRNVVAFRDRISKPTRVGREIKLGISYNISYPPPSPCTLPKSCPHYWII